MAAINDVLWTRLFLDNRDSLVEELDELLRNLSRIRNAVAEEDQEQLQELLREAARIKAEVG